LVDGAPKMVKEGVGKAEAETMPSRSGPMFTALLDGHVASDFLSGEMEFHFSPDGGGDCGSGD